MPWAGVGEPVGWRVSSTPSIRARRRALLPGLLSQLRTEAQGRDLESDPLRYVHRYRDRRDQEIVGWLASTLAFGRVAAVFLAIDRVLERLGPSPAHTVQSLSPPSLALRLEGTRHRWLDGADLAWALAGLGRIQAAHGSLEPAFGDPGETLSLRLAHFSDAMLRDLRAPRPRHRFLFPDPRRGSAAKRALLFLRWMVRSEPGVDLGIWKSVTPSELVIPLDTHVAFFGRALGLTRRATPDWKMAVEITAALAVIDPEDPVSFDWALSRLGISGRCRHRLVPALCSPCPLRAVCRLSHRPSLRDGHES